MSSDSRLLIDRIYGTSSNNQLNYAISTNLVAYIASGGVVVAQIDKRTGSLSSEQRFLCAYNAGNGSATGASNADAYLNLIQGQSSHEEKDQFGNPKLPNTITISNDRDVTGQLGALSLNPSSPPKQVQKIKAISCVAISPDEKFLAVGETGSQPRILVFSLAPDANEYPLLSLTEHNFGILGLKFSPNSKYLLSIGVNHDSFLYLWRLNGVNTSIVGANRCTSQINGILWIDKHFITYGIRHIKIWKFEEFESKSMIDGKNVILGDLLNGNFVYATGDDIDEVLLLTTAGEICHYNSSTNSMTLRHKLEGENMKVGAIFKDLYNGKLWIGSDRIEPLDLGELHVDLAKGGGDKSPDSPSKIKFEPHITGISQISENFLIYLTFNEEIQLFDIRNSTSKHLIDALSKSISGVKVASNGKFISWTKDGVIKAIDPESLDIDLFGSIEIEEVPNKVINNHVTALDLSQSNDIIVGDAYGTLSVYDQNKGVVFSMPSHEFTINDLTYFTVENYEVIVSIGRDRMIQVFAKREEVENKENQLPGASEIGYEWSIFQTLDEHRGNLLKLLYHNHRILVSSADRSISIHKFSVDEQGGLAIEKEKTLSVKSSPLAMAVFKGDIVISTNDKNITVYNGETLESTKSFKLYDNENESLLVDNLQITQDNLLVCSCSDKSIRAFNYLNHKQLSVNWGHSEAIRELVLISSNHLISLSNSGCLFAWSMYNKSQSLDSSKSTIQKYNELATPPKVIRKVKKPASVTPLSKRQPLSPSVARTPAARLQSTSRLTPSKLTNSTKTNLSPSTPKSSPRPSSPRLANSPSTPTTTRFNTRSSIAINSKTRLSELQSEKIKVEDVITCLRKFKDNIEDYTVGEVDQVKRELNEIFNVEESLLDRFSEKIMKKVGSSTNN